MKFRCFQQRSLALYISLLIVALLFAADVTAQSRRGKTVSKKTAASAKDARKEKLNARTAKTSKKDSKKDKASARTRDSKRDKRDDRLAAKGRDRDDRKADSKKGSKRSADARRLEEARRRAEAERRAAIIAEQRRREQAAREARARQLAFERGLHEQTEANIEKDDTQGEDLQVRRAAVDALGRHAGTVVVMEAQTGKVVTIVNQDWAIRNGFKPCSTIKLVTGVAGLSENVIDSEGNVVGVNTRRQLQDAIAFSDNGYFQRVGSNLGNGKMIAYAKTLGLGEQTGINVDGENPGKLPYGNSNARIYSHGDDFEVTPLQLAVLVSAISNGGKRVVPQIPRTRYESTNFRGRYRQQVPLPQQDLKGLIPGMIGAAAYGTAHRGVDASMGVAGKTGSCISKGSWVGLFASVAPVENPKYSVVVITRGQGERGKYAAAVAGKIYEALRPRIGNDPGRTQLLAPVKPKAPVDSRTARAADEDDDEDEDENAAAGDVQDDVRAADVVRAPVRTATVERAPEKKLITKTVQTKPTTFPPVIIEYRKDGTTRPRIVKNK
jgi:cell division protein FtsI/penicillin-binding protein 2